MKTIEEGNKAIRKLLGTQDRKAGPYRLMKYLVSAECDEGILLHNVITGQMVLVNEEENHLIHSAPRVYSNQMDELIQGLFLVPDGYNERDTVYKLRRILERLFAPRYVDSYIILPTTDCNARCYYCFENGLHSISMSHETAAKLVEYIVAHSGKCKIHLNWFGGEPLLGADIIGEICRMLDDRGINYYSTMISNGYLFTPQIIEKAVKSWKLNMVQITLDGTEDVYNSVKAYKNISNSAFKTVMDNINHLLVSNVQVEVRLNLDQKNYNDLKELIYILNDRFSHFPNFQVYVRTLQKDTGFAPIPRTKEIEHELYSKQVELTEWLKTLGLSKRNTNLPSLNFMRCVSDNPGMLVVYPDGRLYKCENITETENIGSIYSDKFDSKIDAIYRERIEMDECQTCSLFPKCILLKRCPANEAYSNITCNYEMNCLKETMIYKYQANMNKQTI